MTSTDLFGCSSDSGAIFSQDARYRYQLWRLWNDALPVLMFLMLNPSTADATANDRTVAKCIQFAKRWGYGKLYVGNVFAWRATDPEEMKKTEEPIGGASPYADVLSMNDQAILEMAAKSSRVVCAWGKHGAFLGRGEFVF